MTLSSIKNFTVAGDNGGGNSTGAGYFELNQDTLARQMLVVHLN